MNTMALGIDSNNNNNNTLIYFMLSSLQRLKGA